MTERNMGEESQGSGKLGKADRRKKRYRALFLDLDNTLLDFDASESEAFKKVLVRFGMKPEDEFVREYHQINRQCWELFEEGKLEKSTVLIRRFEIFFSGHGRGEVSSEAEALYRAFLGESAILIPGALELCRDLSREYRLYAATNGVAQTQYKRLKKSGLTPFFSGVFVSEEAGSQKPQKEFFDYCFRKIEEASLGAGEGSGCSLAGEKDRYPVRPEEVLLIGDSLTSDMRGGENAGIDTCWYNPGRIANDCGAAVTMQAASYEEIRSILLP